MIYFKWQNFGSVISETLCTETYFSADTCSERMSPHCSRKVGGEEQSELYKHIKRAVGHGEGKAKQKAANQEGDHERNQRPSITQRQDGKTSMCAC